ncbi:MAG: ATP-binding cassette domain-containing protein [Chloroflexi bacterium]|nr:ATP-binding cassette domain-containing protein [Chloroflexota bacterium]
MNIQNVELSFGGTRLFEGINLAIESGDKVALMGRNGSGKSTLLKLIEGSVERDSGSVVIRKDVRSALLMQVVPNEIQGTVFDVVAGGIKDHFDLITWYHAVSTLLMEENTPALQDELNNIHNALEAHGGWDKHLQVQKIISLLDLNADLVFNNLSAGQKRQVLLGKALVGEPDILLLDEPTNHLDIDSIKRLENILAKFAGTLIFVTHDRMFLQKIATRIVEIDRGKLFDQSCDYKTFLVRKQAALEAEEVENNLFDKKLEKEEHWIRQGVRARRVRNEGRVKELEKMRQIRRLRRESTGLAKMEIQEAERSGKIVAKAKDISFYYDNTPVILNFSTTIMKGDRIGILGPNGSGKTTLLRILLGDLLPMSGNLRIGTRLQINYFDQLREQLDDNKTVWENVSDGKDLITIGGRSRHVIGYLRDFLFTPDQALSRVSLLSGGERNRLLLARMFTRPSNLMVLDEPTNDLDTETIELLEDILMKYEGTVLLVSHDRVLINNVVTSTIVFEGNGVVKEYVGGYDDWLRQRPDDIKEVKETPVKKEAVLATSPKTVKFGFKQQKELISLTETINSLENEQKQLVESMSDPEFYKKEKTVIITMRDRLKYIKKVLDDAYVRWEELEQLKKD